jgi:tetratricopeptide (TPR) repeat protein
MMIKKHGDHLPQRPAGRILDLSSRRPEPVQKIKRRIRPKSSRYGLIIILLLILFIAFYRFYLRGKLQEINYKRGMTNLSQGNFDEAAKNFEKASSGKNETDALYQLAVSKYNQKDFEGAISIYRSVLEKDPQNAPAYNGLGNIYRDQKNYSQAEESYKAAISANSSYIAAYSNWSIMLMDNGNIDGAKMVVNEGLEKNSGSVDLSNIKKVLEE